MNELEILQQKITELEAKNLSLREQLAQVSADRFRRFKSEFLIANLSQNLVENIQTGIIVHDTDTKILFANPTAAKLLGIIQSELEGKDINDPSWNFYHGDGQWMPLEDFPVNKILRERKVLKNYELGLYRPPTNDFVWALINAYPEFDKRGDIARIVVTFVDISNLKKTEIALRESEQRYATLAAELEQTRNFLQNIIDHLPVAVFVKDARTDHFGEMLLWNRTSEVMFGVSAKEAIGKTVYCHFPKEQADFFYQKDLEAFVNKLPENIPEEPIDSHSLGRRILHTVKVPLYDQEEQPQYLLCFSEDVTERKLAELALKESEERFRQMAENIHEIFWMMEAYSQKIIYINPAYESISGRSCASLYEDPQSFINIIHIEDRDMVAAAHQKNHQTGWGLEYRIVRPNGDIRWIFESAVPVLNSEGTLQSIVGIGQDITERKSTEQELVYQAFHDSLTNLPNRLLFTDRLEMSLKRTKRFQDHTFAVLFIDLDRFKVINDSLGHLIGDRLLIEIADILKKSVRSFDTVARLGGDEFTILLDEISGTQEAVEVAERIHLQLKKELAIDGYKILTSASIGIVVGSNNYESAGDLLRDADIAMYRAKDQGRACYEIFDQAMYDSALSRLQIENELRKAIEKTEFVVFYEPIISLKSMNLCGFEALVRWKHPEKGLLAAGEFIPICEELGLIIPLGKWVLQSACRQIKLWLEKFPIAKELTINVNLSGKQLQDPDIIRVIDDILQETEISTSNLNLEITETILIENTEIAIRVFQQLRARHIHLSLDDFGTGFSSLSYLQRFPVNTIKIDRSFISHMNSKEINSDRNIEIVKAIIALAHAMNIKVIAEGIEKKEQIIQLQAWDCDFAQGYYFARSLSAEAASDLLGKAAQSAVFS
ncbi:EAL domain-containing protein [Pseudanabaena sp. FACHB-1998]|uniref:EAL domain-containing protein n=1 Tax=Pseudanabaena sp. FACHB-1998 TaxID=2692858 RepID=UPI001680FAA2|nr:EAL domain-containing protein [Pseudanabaena sp. FACHB-1998]MBD2176077.1 EAL domain-containing protein [Pseudanabaena sp. FACHB-1998]